MSYILKIWEHPDAAPLPSAIDDIVTLVDRLGRHPGEQRQKFLKLAARLTDRYPCITAASGRKSSKAKPAWSDGPLDGRCDSRVYSIGINRDLLDEVRSFVVVQANDLGLHVLDEQAADVFFADGKVISPRDEGQCIRGFAAYFSKDYPAALAEFRTLAEKGNGAAQYNLGVMYSTGEGVAMNPVVAYALHNLAANHGYSHGTAARKQVAQSMAKPALLIARSLCVRMVATGEVGGSIDDYLANPLPEAEMYAPGRRPGETDPQYAKRLKPLAEQGDSDAQLLLGEIYRQSFTVARNLKTALKWVRLAAESGLVAAQYRLADMFEQGHGTRQNYIEAAKWFRQAADSGDIEASFRLGRLQEKGLGLEKNVDEAMGRYRRAAEAGSAGAQLLLGVKYQQGTLVPKDENEAAKWERLAAAQGIPLAIGGVAMHYFGGRVAPKSMFVAYALRRLAHILNPMDEPDTILRVTDERLSAEERAAANRLLVELGKPGNFLPALEQATSVIAS